MRLNDLSKQKNPFSPEIFIAKLQDFITFMEGYKNSEAMRKVDTQKIIIFISYLNGILDIERRRQELESV
jgi:hypothetical protein